MAAVAAVVATRRDSRRCALLKQRLLMIMCKELRPRTSALRMATLLSLLVLSPAPQTVKAVRWRHDSEKHATRRSGGG